MADYQIVCVETKEPHEGIIAVGTSDNGVLADKRWTVEGVREAIEGGHRFYTVGPESGDVADVELFGDGIRTNPDETTDNNLDELRVCRFKQTA
jgi:hypothetical protein